MPIARIVRHSPLYLYIKLYSLSCLVSVFASRPISSKIDAVLPASDREHDDGNTSASQALVRQIQRIQLAAQETLRRQRRREAWREDSVASIKAAAGEKSKDERVQNGELLRTPYALKTLATDADVSNALLPQPLHGVRAVSRTVKRWGRRLRDLSNVKTLVMRDFSDARRHKEVLLDARVRLSPLASDGERAFIQTRASRASSNLRFLAAVGISHDQDGIHADDVPTVAVGGSGGGFRATFGFLGAIQGLERAGLYQGVTFLSGVSGSCWTIAALYSVARCRTHDLAQHYRLVASEGLHPMSRRALDVVARSPKGVYFLLGPLLAKLQNGKVGIGIMDMYATLTSSYQLLSRSPQARPRLSRSTFQFSRFWDRAGLDRGLHPLPILTAVRIKRDAPSSAKPSAPEAMESLQHYQEKVQKVNEGRPASTRYQWWEMNPLEVGSADEGAWVPTWSFGRSFLSGQSVSRAPETSLAMLLGQATSAPAGPLTGYIAALLATLPRGTIMSRLLSRLNEFALHKRWERRWGNPIRGADEPNPLYGYGQRDAASGAGWEKRGRVKLMDSGMSNNLPNHIFTSSARQADIIVSFDMSSDVRSGAALERLHDFAVERQLRLVRWNVPEQGTGKDTDLTSDQKSIGPSEKIRVEHHSKYAQIFAGWRAKGNADAVGLQSEVNTFNLEEDEPSPELFIIYCPLLPNAIQPDFDPTNSAFSTSYNLIWTPEEVDVLLTTARANAYEYAAPALRAVYAYMHSCKKQRRLGRRKGKDVD